MATSKWYFDLRENTITLDEKEDYEAIPRKMLSLTPIDLAKWIAEERTEYRIDTIENIINIYEDMLIKALCGGNTYVSRVHSTNLLLRACFQEQVWLIRKRISVRSI